MKPLTLLLGGLAALPLAACDTFAADPPVVRSGAAAPAPATALLRDAAGRGRGTASALQVGDSIRVRIEVAGLPSGAHGAHVHTIGRCSPPDFSSAGPHWNPTSRQHGKDNPAGMHLGDLPNVMVGTDGRGALEYMIARTYISQMLDRDGAALVIHAQADDGRSDPSGNSGGRIACGAFR
ncbi:MAG TPA: superoxide dismutase family protein [Allosphingosinicella sp.]|nr:superoxide dismutase family protein [Allosphingosinicella sp.]